MMTFWRNFYRVEKSSTFGAKLFWVQGKNKFRRGATWNNNRGTEGGGREIWFNLPLHTSAWKRRWKSRRSFSCYVSRLKMKNVKKKKIVRVSLLLITLFTMLNTVCLGYAQGKKFEGINQREERRRSETKRWLVKPSFHQSGKCFCKILPTRKAIFSFDWKSKRFSVFWK